MEELQSRKDKVITGFDKGKAVVILDVEDYVREAEKKLNYRKIYSHSNTAVNETIHKVLSRFQKENLIILLFF